jgi:hypothetical protein
MTEMAQVTPISSPNDLVVGHTRRLSPPTNLNTLNSSTYENREFNFGESMFTRSLTGEILMLIRRPPQKKARSAVSRVDLDFHAFFI